MQGISLFGVSGQIFDGVCSRALSAKHCSCPLIPIEGPPVSLFGSVNWLFELSSGRPRLEAARGLQHVLEASGLCGICHANQLSRGVTHQDHGGVHQHVAILEFDTLDDTMFASRLRQDDELHGVRSLVLTFMEIGGGKSA